MPPTRTSDPTVRSIRDRGVDVSVLEELNGLGTHLNGPVVEILEARGHTYTAALVKDAVRLLDEAHDELLCLYPIDAVEESVI